MSRRLQFFHFGLMPYPYIPPGSEIESTWVTLSNAPLRPEGRPPPVQRVPRPGRARREARLRRHLRQRAPPERLRHDARPERDGARTSSPARRRSRVGIIGNALPLHDNPLRVAEAVAMLDVISRGPHHLRLRARDGHGVPLDARQPGLLARALLGGPRPHPQGVDGATARSTGRASTSTSPTSTPGRGPTSSRIRRSGCPGRARWRRSREAAKRRYPFMMVFAPLVVHQAQLRHVPPRGRGGRLRAARPSSSRSACRRTSPRRTRRRTPEAREHYMWLFHTGLKVPAYQHFPPGYTSGRSLRGMLEGKREVRHEGPLGPHLRGAGRRAVHHRRLARHGRREA